MLRQASHVLPVQIALAETSRQPLRMVLMFNQWSWQPYRRRRCKQCMRQEDTVAINRLVVQEGRGIPQLAQWPCTELCTTQLVCNSGFEMAAAQTGAKTIFILQEYARSWGLYVGQSWPHGRSFPASPLFRCSSTMQRARLMVLEDKVVLGIMALRLWKVLARHLCKVR